MLFKRKSRFVVLGALMAVVVALAGSASATTADDARATDPQAVECTQRYSPSGAHVTFCWVTGIFIGFDGERMNLFKVSATVHGTSFGQIEWKNSHGQAIFQGTLRPTFTQYFPNVGSLKFRACNSGGCGAFS